MNIDSIENEQHWESRKQDMRDNRTPLRIITTASNNNENMRRAIQACNVQETMG